MLSDIETAFAEVEEEAEEVEERFVEVKTSLYVYISMKGPSGSCQRSHLAAISCLELTL